MASKKKIKDSVKCEEDISSTFPRKSSSRAKSFFENDFVTSEESPMNVSVSAKFNFENDLETSEAESPTVVNKPLRNVRQHRMFEKGEGELRPGSLKEAKRVQMNKPKSLFEDDFSPSEKLDLVPEDNSISSIKEESDPIEEEDSFSTNNFENATNSRKNKIKKHRLSNNTDINLKKSESVNIFARENDPFDDDFFSVNAAGEVMEELPRVTDLKWTDDFDNYGLEQRQ